MSGRRNVMDSRGGTYEDCAKLLIGQIANLIAVPRDKDFGVDFYCEPRVSAGPGAEAVWGLCSLQVKGGSSDLTYGGLNDRSQWKDYEFGWLKSQATPLYLVKVLQDCEGVEMYSLWPIWLVFWQQSGLPFELVFITETPGKSAWKDPVATPHPKGTGHGDGNRWTIYLGPPFLLLTSENLKNATFRQQATTILRTRIVYDRANLMRYHQFIPALTGITGWSTNTIELPEVREWHFWSSTPGENIRRLCLTAGPLLVNLGIHLQWQNDRAAYRLIPVLEWIDQYNYLDEIGRGLLRNLRATEAAGIGPSGEGMSGREGGVSSADQE